MNKTNYDVLINYDPENNSKYIVEVRHIKTWDLGASYNTDDGDVKLYMNGDIIREGTEHKFVERIISIEEFNSDYAIYQVLDEHERVVYK